MPIMPHGITKELNRASKILGVGFFSKSLCDPHRATVIGIDRQYALRGIQMTSPDIRAGVSLLIAALSAEGKSVIHNIEQIDRGYQDIEMRLNNIGADIRRIG